MKNLRDEGFEIGRDRTRRLMKVLNLKVKQKGKYKVTTDSRHHLPVAENVLNRQFPIRLVGDPVHVAMWQQHDVHVLELHQGAVLACAQHAVAIHRDVETRRHRRLQLHAPGCGQLRAEENTATKTQGFQHVAKYVEFFSWGAEWLDATLCIEFALFVFSMGSSHEFNGVLQVDKTGDQE